VDDHDLVARAHVLEDVIDRAGGDPPAKLHDDARHVVYSAFSRT
jgi:hypothetical protein